MTNITLGPFATRLVAFWGLILPYLTVAFNATKAFALTFWAKFIQVAGNPVTSWNAVMASEWGVIIRWVADTSVTVFNWVLPRAEKALDTVIVPGFVAFILFCKEQVLHCLNKHKDQTETKEKEDQN